MFLSCLKKNSNTFFKVNQSCLFHLSSSSYGIKDFFDPVLPPGEVFVHGREWTVSDLRRKVIFV